MKYKLHVVSCLAVVLVSSHAQGQQLVHILDDPTESAEDRFGWSVALSGNHVLVGAFMDNTISNNTGGVRILESVGNTFFHNNFIDNKIQVISRYSKNMWDNGYPSGGNY